MGEADHDPPTSGVSQTGIQAPPVQGFVIDWKRHSLPGGVPLTIVTLFDDNGDQVLVQRWIPAQRLTPVHQQSQRRQTTLASTNTPTAGPPKTRWQIDQTDHMHRTDQPD